MRLLSILLLFSFNAAEANQPIDWQLGFQKSASKSMEDIVWFHDFFDNF